MIWHRLPVLLALLLVACGDGEDEPLANIPPWHLWGDTKTIVVPHSIALVEEYSSQLAKVSYGRPETWDFMFGARIVNLSEPLDTGEIEVHFDVTIGVGRSHLQMLSFEYFMFYWTALPAPLNVQKYSAEVLGPNRTDIPIPPATTIPANVISEITAQDIQVQTRLIYTGGAIPVKTATVEVTAFFAPRSHIRPEWFKGEFPGGEDNGT
jgi:hypothetical protein